MFGFSSFLLLLSRVLTFPLGCTFWKGENSGGGGRSSPPPPPAPKKGKWNDWRKGFFFSWWRWQRKIRVNGLGIDWGTRRGEENNKNFTLTFCLKKFLRLCTERKLFSSFLFFFLPWAIFSGGCPPRVRKGKVGRQKKEERIYGSGLYIA